MLSSVARELDDLGADGGGVVDPLGRRRAFAAYRRADEASETLPRHWRHDYAALPFADLVWSTGRLRVPARDATVAGLVHSGSTYLEATAPFADGRVRLSSLADAAQAYPERVAAVHGSIVAFDRDRFTALSTAFQNCGAFVDVPAEVAVEAPIQLVWTSRPGEASAVFPHTVVHLGTNASATIVERHLGDSESFVAGIVEIELEPGARLDYIVMQEADPGARLFFRRAARCAEGATVTWHLAELGAALSRTFVDLRLSGDGATGDVNALFFANGFSNVDMAVDVAHAGADTHSNTIVRSAAGDRAAGRFVGDIRIQPSAHAARAAMRDDALVLSRDAYLESVPALEIGTNDVSVSHAATVGSLDEGQLFYLQTRGIARGAAERMVALAFFEPAISRFPGDAFREEVRTALDARLDEVPDTFAS